MSTYDLDNAAERIRRVAAGEIDTRCGLEIMPTVCRYTDSPKDIVIWKARCIEHFRDGYATDSQWQEMADMMLHASENGNLDVTIGLDTAIDPFYDLEPDL